MRRCIQPFLTLIRKGVCTFKFGREFTAWYHDWRKRRRVLAARRRLQRYGWEVLARCSEMFATENIPAYAEYGTLLGLVREGGFIKHDDDIDFGVAPDGIDPKRLLDVALAYGLEFCRAFSWHGKITELTFKYKGVPIDFFFTYRHDDGRVYGQVYNNFTNQGGRRVARLVKRLYKPGYDGVEMLAVNNIEVPVPKNKEEYLEFSYGDGWRTPIQRFNAEQLKQNREYLDEEAFILKQVAEIL